ncbi:AraC family transcriptional regulator [Vallitalea sediminicola]
MRRVEENKTYYRDIIDKQIIQNDSVLYTVSSYAGKGTMRSYSVMPGVEIIYNDIELFKPLSKTMKIDVDCIEINYCLKGHVEIKFKNQKYAYMSDGDLSLFNCKTDALYCDFSTKPYVGITIMLYLPYIIESLDDMLNTTEFIKDSFFGKVFDADSCIIDSANESVEHIFKELWVLPDKYKNHLMKIKVTELLLYLLSDSDYKNNRVIYFSKSSVDKIKEARRIIVSRIDEWITVQTLSKLVGMNVTDLEKGFKSIYDHPVFTYARIRKMQKAKELLTDTNMSIIDIALDCGYSNGGKFAKAFKNEFNMTPSKYRKSSVVSKP